MGISYLLDTHILLWWLFNDPKLSPECRDIPHKSCPKSPDELGAKHHERSSPAEPNRPYSHIRQKPGFLVRL